MTSAARHRRILIIDDEKLIRWTLRERLEREGYVVAEAEHGAAAFEAMRQEEFDLLLLDFKLPDTDGLEILKVAKERRPAPAVILMTAFASVQNAVEAMRLGAYDYVKKPFNLDELLLDVEKAIETVTLRAEVSRYQSLDRARFSVANLVGSSPKTQEIRKLVQRVAKSGARTILISGETGTGKGMVARAIHFESDAANTPFLNITCTALPETLLESELFGHERGAFTDARTAKKGLLELADSGTVFLDEIGDMTLSLQGKLLRFLEDKTFRRLGGTRDISVDVRVIAATNKDLKVAVKQGGFRADLYYRLNVIPIPIPPLVQRKEDIHDLVRHFVAMFSEEFKKPVRGFDADAMKAMGSYAWPGNIRELKNTIERALLLADNELLTLDDLPFEIREGAAGAGARAATFSLPKEGCDLDEVHRDLLMQALERSRHNKTGAGRLLGLNRDQVRYWMRKYKIPDKQPGEA
jgi:two-component system, NtrC family, response regulator AtoC